MNRTTLGLIGVLQLVLLAGMGFLINESLLQRQELSKQREMFAEAVPIIVTEVHSENKAATLSMLCAVNELFQIPETPNLEWRHKRLYSHCLSREIHELALAALDYPIKNAYSNDEEY